MQSSHRRGGAWRAIKLGLVVLVAVLITHGILGANGLLTYLQKRREHAALAREIRQMKQDNADLQKEVRGLQSDPAAIEEHAREDLHMSRRNEKIYILPQQTSDPKPADPRRQPSDPAPRKPYRGVAEPQPRVEMSR